MKTPHNPQENKDNNQPLSIPIDYTLSIYYLKDKISKEMRVLGNLAKLGRKCLEDKKTYPLIKVLEAEGGKVLFLNYMEIKTSITEAQLKAPFSMDFITDIDDPRTLHIFTYENSLVPALSYDLFHFQCKIESLDNKDFKEIVRLSIEKYANTFGIKPEVSDILAMQHHMDLETCQWEILAVK